MHAKEPPAPITTGPSSVHGRIARIGDTVQCNKCGATGKIIVGSPSVFVDKF